ncbi:cupin domain-containing protein [Rhizobium sp. MC63]|uniref:Cupin domain-containing protein n=1 Tax=Rhizobium mulingense TaxID=3031128 RepID=A0ACC6N2J1_9HYPH|nr:MULTISPECIES: cupin domain-containing protein [unclassified Rhizobium]MDF0699299.1 cupin domain-containing protein [Rhizobium sp. MC63]MEA3519617.1 cupin domain-containing protein [Rhizobium sp. MJ31]
MSVAARTVRTVTWNTTYTINIGRFENGGILGLFESKVPAGSGPPIHIHHNEDVVIHVIEGDYEFWCDGELVPVSPGSSIFLPRVPHTFG